MSESGAVPLAWPYGFTSGELPGGVVTPSPGVFYFSQLPGSNPAKTEAYVFHCTVASRLPSIATQGLVPAREGEARWEFWGAGRERLIGRLYAAEDLRQAGRYCFLLVEEELDFERFTSWPVMLRFQPVPEDGFKTEPKYPGDLYTEHCCVAPERLEIYWDGKWRSLTEVDLRKLETAMVQWMGSNYVGPFEDSGDLGETTKEVVQQIKKRFWPKAERAAKYPTADNPEWLEYLDAPAKGVILQDGRFFGWRVDAERHRPHHDMTGERHFEDAEIAAKITFRDRNDLQIAVFGIDPEICQTLVKEAVRRCVGWTLDTRLYLFIGGEEQVMSMADWERRCHGQIVSENPLTAAPMVLGDVELLEKIFVKHWRGLERRAKELGGLEWLPARVSVGGGMTELIPAELEEQYGCGGFGCVYKTGLESIVFKLTADLYEALLVKVILDMQAAGVSPPIGIVRYYGLFSIGRYSGSEVFVLWREAAEHIGAGPGGWDAQARRLGMPERDIENTREHLETLYDLAKKLRREFRAAELSSNFKSWVAGQFEYFLMQAPDMFAPQAEVYFGQDYAFAADLGRYDWAAQQLAKTKTGRLIGQAARKLLRQGIVLTDMHDENVGHVRRKKTSYTPGQIVLTDPGYSLMLSPSFWNVEASIEKL